MFNIDSLVSIIAGSDSASFVTRLRLEAITVDGSTKCLITSDSFSNVISFSNEIRTIEII